MKLIERKYYLDKLIRVIDTPDIKVITGVRRSGKSKLLEALQKYITENYKNANIIHINYNLKKFDKITTGDSLYEYVDKNFINGKDNFILIDEIQKCKDFEETINSFHAEERFKIFLTGSNAFLLSSDLATLFTGRTFEVAIFPFSFEEYMTYYNYDNKYSAFDKYLKEGGMAGSYLYKEDDDKSTYIKDIYETLIIRDVVQKYKIRNKDLLNKLSDYLLDNISNITSSTKIEKTLSSNKLKADHKTIHRYIEYLCNAFAFYKVRRYDIRGKKYLVSQDKYYLSDHSFRTSILGKKNMDYGRILENIVAVELLRRGYEIYVGTLYNKEIDFVAMRRDEQIYIQVSENISAPKTLEREISPLLSIKDGYKKIIITRLNHERYLKEGIEVIDIADWLLD